MHLELLQFIYIESHTIFLSLFSWGKTLQPNMTTDLIIYFKLNTYLYLDPCSILGHDLDVLLETDFVFVLVVHHDLYHDLCHHPHDC